jgi:hypothetical protein
VRGGAAPLLAWGGLLIVLGAGLAVWSGGAPSLLLVGGALPLLVLAAWSAARPPRDGARRLPRVSVPVVVVAVGLALAALGLTAGLWLGLVGGELALVGVVWLGRELLDERRTDG